MIFKPKNNYDQIARAETVGQLIEILSLFPRDMQVKAHTEKALYGEWWPIEVCHSEFIEGHTSGLVSLYGRQPLEHEPYTEMWSEQEELYLGHANKFRSDGSRINRGYRDDLIKSLKDSEIEECIANIKGLEQELRDMLDAKCVEE